MNDDINTIKNLLQYYRNKCAQLEFDFVLYKIQTDKELQSRSREHDVQNSTNERKDDDKSSKTF